MNTPWFFLSYASISPNHDRQVKKFFSDLVEAVRDIEQLKTNEVPDEDLGFCALQISEGTNWAAELCHKLNSCRVLVCLYSRAYFRSPQCGREFEIFRQRLNDDVRSKRGQPPALIIPVPWVVSKNFDERFLPTALKPIHYKYPGFEDARNQKGIYYYLKIHANNTIQYDEYVNNLAETITRVAKLKPALLALTNGFDFETTINAFADYSEEAPTEPDEVLEDSVELQTKPAQIDFSAEAISLTKIKLRWKSVVSINVKIERRLEAKGEFKSVAEVNRGATEYVDSGLRPATTYVYRIAAADKLNGHIGIATDTVTTRPIPVHWYLIVAAALVIMASLAFSFRCKIPGVCGSVAIKPMVVIEKEPWDDHFDRNPTAGPNVWLKSGEWTYPTDKWTTAAGRGNSINDRALVVDGTTPGLTTRVFDDFTATFTVSYLSGNKAGWFIRAEEGARVGYQFLLVKPAQPKDDDFILTATAVGSPNSVIKTDTCTFSLKDYGQKPEDFIDVEVTAINNQFTYLFTLKNPVPFNDPRKSIKVPQPVRCSNPIKDEGKYLLSGQLGFFAVDRTRFKVEQIDVTPLKQN